MTVTELFQQAQELSPEERKELANLLFDSLVSQKQSDEMWTDEELEEILKIEPMTGAEIVAAGLTGTWDKPEISDGGTWREAQKQKRREKKRW